jgi:Putative restriction endonuclease
MDSIVLEKKSRKAPVKVPEYLIYEMVKGKPIYYKGYKDVLNKTKTYEEIIMDSTLQAWLKSRLTILLGNYLLANGYDITTGEQGLFMPNGDKRGADIAIFKANELVLDAHYARNAPEIIVEIDVKIHTENTTEFDYVVEKVSDYHAFGVKNVIWIFTKNKKIMVAKSDQPWLTLDWNTDVVVIEGLTINLAHLIGHK